MKCPLCMRTRSRTWGMLVGTAASESKNIRQALTLPRGTQASTAAGCHKLPHRTDLMCECEVETLHGVMTSGDSGSS
jgi:hypothetical protein